MIINAIVKNSIPTLGLSSIRPCSSVVMSSRTSGMVMKLPMK